MRGILSFNLPEDREEFEMCQNGWKWNLVVHDILQELRKYIKYEDKETINTEEFRQFIFDTMNSYGVED
jgi:hypothetical protein